MMTKLVPSIEVAKTPKATPTELLNLAARCETMAGAFQKYGSTAQSLQSAAYALRSAVGHAMKEVQDEETVLEVETE